MTAKPQIKVQTAFVPIQADSTILPKSAHWFIRNDGFKDFFINDNFRVAPGDKFGIDLTPIVAMFLKKGINVEFDTQLKITFANVNVVGYASLLQIDSKLVTATGK